MSNTDEVFAGVHVSYEDFYNSIIFLVAIYIFGEVLCGKLLRIVPSLVGEMVAGMILGPPLLNMVQPSPATFVLFGQLGLLLLMVQAGLEMDVVTLKLIGVRGVVIAIIGSILPIAIGTGITLALGYTLQQSIAAGCSFGPTSAGIAMNVLQRCGVLDTSVGRLIVAAAIVDDMLALVVLSQLKALTGELSVAGVVVPIVSAVAFLVVGGFVALKVLPVILDSFLKNIKTETQKTTLQATILTTLLLALIPATHYSRASYLMGAFLTGLAFCNRPPLHQTFLSHLERMIQWLMRLFFAATIGFQVPIQNFGSPLVLGQGAILTLALSGKLAVGLLTPNMHQPSCRRFTGKHRRDCLVVGFSMAGEAEFAFAIAVYGVGQGLTTPDLYAAIVFAILCSTILAPLLLNLVIRWYKDGDGLEMERDGRSDVKSEGNGCLGTESESDDGIRHAES